MNDVSIVKSNGLNAQEITTTFYSSNNSLIDKLYNNVYQYPYQNWDSHSILMCACDSGYFGPDCSLSILLFLYLYIIMFLTSNF